MAEIGHKVVLEACQSTGLAKNVYGDTDDHNDKQGHHYLGNTLNALFNAQKNYNGCEGKEEEEPTDGFGRSRNEVGEIVASVGCSLSLAGCKDCYVLGDPTAYNAVVGKDNGRNNGGQHTDKRETLVQSLEGTDGAEAGLTADENFGGHKRKAEGHSQNDVNEKEDTSAVFSCKVGETPDVTQTDSRACSRKNEADLAGKITSLFQSCVFAHNKTSQSKCQKQKITSNYHTKPTKIQEVI